MHIYIIQKRIIRIIYKKYLYHTKGLFIVNSLLKLNEITYINTCEFMFKVFNNLHPYIINKTFSLISISHNTRSSNNVSILISKRTVYL